MGLKRQKIKYFFFIRVYRFVYPRAVLCIPCTRAHSRFMIGFLKMSRDDTNCCNSGYYLVCDLFYPIAPLQQIHCRLYFDIKRLPYISKNKRSIETATCSQGVTQAIIIHYYSRQLIIDKKVCTGSFSRKLLPLAIV